MNPEPNTQQLLDRLDHGDESASRELLVRGYERLRRLARKIFHTSFPDLEQVHDVDSVVNLAVLRLMRSLEAVKPSTSQDYYRFAAEQIRRVLLDMVRAQPPRASDHAEQARAGACYDSGDSTLDPLKLAQWTEFHKKMETLPAEIREVVDLYWYCGLTQAQTAQKLGLSEKEVSRRWLKGKRRMADWLSS